MEKAINFSLHLINNRRGPLFSSPTHAEIDRGIIYSQVYFLDRPPGLSHVQNMAFFPIKPPGLLARNWVYNFNKRHDEFKTRFKGKYNLRHGKYEESKAH